MEGTGSLPVEISRKGMVYEAKVAKGGIHERFRSATSLARAARRAPPTLPCRPLTGRYSMEGEGGAYVEAVGR